MLLASGEHVVFRTTESEGRDLCVMDNLGRYTLINEEDVETVVDMLQIFEEFETYKINEVDPKQYTMPDESL